MTTALWAVGLVIVSSFLNAFGAILLKKGSGKFNADLLGQIKNLPLIMGLGFYGTGGILYIFALRGGELSILYPFVALSFVWVSILSNKFLKEKMGLLKWIGVGFILFGVSLIGFGI